MAAGGKLSEDGEEMSPLQEKSPLQGGPPSAGGSGGFKYWRYVFAILGAMGMGIIYGLKVNLHIAIVAMVNHTAIKAAANGSGHEGGHHEEVEPEKDGPYEWSTSQQGLIMSAYFIGYLITQIPGGRLAELWSAKLVFLVAVLMNTIGTLLTPLASMSIYALVAVRIFEGCGGGLTFPAENVLINNWAPSNERSSLTSIVFGGAALGTVLSMILSGVIMNWAWEAVFYIEGGLSLIWVVLWIVFVSDSPDSHKFITEEERHMINSSHPPKDENAVKPSAPWLKIFTSPPFIILALCHMCNNFGWYLFLVEVPVFLKVLGVDATLLPIFSMIPFFTNYLFSVAFSTMLDKFRAKGSISTTSARKIAVGTASLLPGLCLLGICLAGENQPAVITLMILAITFFGAMFSGVFSNQNDLAPNFGGILMGITNMLATIPGILVPIVIGMMTEGKSGLAPWHTVFYMTLVILVFEFVIFASPGGSGEVQKWNEG